MGRSRGRVASAKLAIASCRRAFGPGEMATRYYCPGQRLSSSYLATLNRK